MSHIDWLGVKVIGIVFVSVFVLAVFRSTWSFERNTAQYRKYIKLEEERLNRTDALLTRQEQLLERMEALIEKLATERGLISTNRLGITERPTKA